MKMKVCFTVIFLYYYKAIYPLDVLSLRVMPVYYKIEKKKVEDFSASRTTYDNLSMKAYFTKKNISFQLTIALYYLPIVLSNATEYNFIPFNVW